MNAQFPRRNTQFPGEKICMVISERVFKVCGERARATFYGTIRHDDIWREEKLFHAELDVHHGAAGRRQAGGSGCYWRRRLVLLVNPATRGFWPRTGTSKERGAPMRKGRRRLRRGRRRCGRRERSARVTRWAGGCGWVDDVMRAHRSCVRVEFAARMGGARAEARVGRRGARAEARRERSARVGGVLG